jgi:hypothetical protein
MSMRLFLSILAMSLAGAVALPGAKATDVGGQEQEQDMSDQKVRLMKIRIDVEGTAITAMLVDNKTTRDFIALLPLTLILRDYAGTEKISDLPRRLSTEDAPAGMDPSIGDITYYAPWGNLAIFYKDFGYSKGLIKLGKIDSGIEAFSRADQIRVTIESVEK